MSQPETVTLLNQLLAVICRSFPQYLKYAQPYIPGGRNQIMETLDSIVTDQNALAERLSHMIIDRDMLPRTGEFPMEYTDCHDLQIDFLLRAAIQYQDQDIAMISDVVNQLQSTPGAKSLAEEALGMSKGHRDSLQELLENGARSD